METAAYLFFKNSLGMIKWHNHACFDMLLFSKFVQMLSVVDFIVFIVCAANMLPIYIINK